MSEDSGWPFIFKEEKTEGWPESCVCVCGLHFAHCFVLVRADPELIVRLSASSTHSMRQASLSSGSAHIGCPHSSQVLVLLP